MKTKKLIITLVAVMLVTFAAAPSVNANPVIAAVIPFAALLTGFGLIAADIHQTNADQQKIEAALDDPLRDDRMISKGENRWED